MSSHHAVITQITQFRDNQYKCRKMCCVNKLHRLQIPNIICIYGLITICIAAIPYCKFS
jgi:hypothetical protein